MDMSEAQRDAVLEGAIAAIKVAISMLQFMGYKRSAYTELRVCIRQIETDLHNSK